MIKKNNLLCILLFIFVCSISANEKNILILNSYHQGFKWTDDLVTGITESIGKDFSDVEFIIEYMDSKRNPFSASDSIQYSDFLKKRYRNDIVMVITTDNYALDFVLENYDDLFPDVPVVFSGYNKTREELDHAFLNKHRTIYEIGNIYGIIESPRLSPTLDFIELLQPEVDHIYIIADDTKTGARNLDIIIQNMKKFESRFMFSILQANHMDWESMSVRLSSLTQDSVVFFLDYFTDLDGNYYSPENILPMICRTSTVPVYTHVDLYMGYGLLGGNLNRGLYHGHLAGNMASDILKGKDISLQRIISPSPSQIVVDCEVLNRFGISLNRVPYGAILINEPPSFIQTHVTSILATFILVTLISIFFMIYSFRIKKDNKKLLERKRQFNAVFEGVNEAIFILDSQYEIIIDVNKNVQVIFGHYTEDILGKNFQHLFNIDFEDNLADGAEYQIPHKEGFTIWCSVILKDLCIDDKPFHMITIRNITEIKNYQLNMEKALRDKNILLQEVHHRVKNNFQIISSLLNLQIEQAGDEEFEKYLREPVNRVEAMAQAHHFLYRNQEMTDILFSDYLLDIISRIEYAYKLHQTSIKIQYEFGTNHVLSIDQAILCGLILNELVTNSIKYAFTDMKNENCYIWVRLIHSKDKMTLIVEDNGKGMETPSCLKGLGLSLVENLSDQLGGSFSLSSENGVRGILEFTCTTQVFSV